MSKGPSRPAPDLVPDLLAPERAANGRSPATPELLEKHPLRAIVKLGAPTTGVMLIATISNVLHIYFVSRLGSDSIAAVSLVFPISLIVITIMGAGIGTGIASAIARALGAGQVGQARALAEHALVITAAAAVVFTVTLVAGSGALFRIMGGEGEVLRQATVFARTLFAGLAITFLCGSLDNMMRGEGNVRIPAMCATLSLGMQIVLTPVLMFTAGLGIVGAPLATLSGQLIGAIPRARYVFGGHGLVRPHILPSAVARRHFIEILRVGIPASLAATLNFAALIVMTGIFAHFGSAHLAAYGLGTRLGFLLFSLGYGVAVAALTLIGMAAGARRPDLVSRLAVQTVVLVASFVAIPALLVVWKPAVWLSIFTDNQDIHRIGAEYFRIVGPSYIFVVVTMVLASSFQGLGRATVPLAVMGLRVGLVVTVAIVLTRALSCRATTVFVVIAAGNVLSPLLLGMMFRRTVRRLPR